MLREIPISMAMPPGGDAVRVGMLYNLPGRLLPGCRRPVCGSDGLSAVFGRNVEVPRTVMASRVADFCSWVLLKPYLPITLTA